MSKSEIKPETGGERKAESGESSGRRRFLGTAGAAAVAAAFGIPVIMSVRSCVPNVLYEEPQRFKIGGLDKFTDGPTFIADKRLFVFRDKNTFHCIGATCTHLGCTVQLVRLKSGEPGNDYEFQCPCHGSKYHADGVNYAGPAPRPLPYFKIEIAPDDGQLVVDMSQIADRGWRLTV
ncbi:MAG: ubiquinol-cytochrome c reductase iron-sulfur subunit [bacterium]|jgi:menaquinol-cytochrome c reductase iron-sulfur subunit